MQLLLTRAVLYFTSPVLAVLVLTLGLTTFGQPLLFDRIMVITLAAVALYCWPLDRNVCLLILMLLGTRLLEEGLWLIRTEQWYFKILIYSAGLVICYALRYSVAARLTAGLILLTFACHLYWTFVGYQAPRTTWSVMMLILAQGLRHLVFMRPHLMKQYKLTAPFAAYRPADLRLHDLLLLHAALEAAQLTEYLARHLFGQSHWLTVYTLYPYVMQALSCAVLWVMLDNAWQLLKTQRLAA